MAAGFAREAKDRETPRAALAFADYVALGPSRSLRGLHEHYLQQSAHKPPTRRLETLADWSVRYRWQARISTTTTEAAEMALALAAEFDAESFLRTSAALAALLDRMPAEVDGADMRSLDAIIDVREAVRRREPRRSVQAGLSLRSAVDQVAGTRGLSVAEVLGEAERSLRDDRP
ncbi:MAG: hypothetical protein KC442_13055 [Thermomicrobiales bacterium]|nr:hypothetical protein [Thermomicrobiales bacterium]